MSDKQSLKQKVSCVMKNNQKTPKFITAKKQLQQRRKWLRLLKNQYVQS